MPTTFVSNWLIGRMIVEDEQDGEYSAEYGKQLIDFLAENLSKEYGNGYSSTNLRYFRQFYLLYPIHHAVSDELSKENHHSVSDDSLEIKRSKRNTLRILHPAQMGIDKPFKNLPLQAGRLR